MAGAMHGDPRRARLGWSRRPARMISSPESRVSTAGRDAGERPLPLDIEVLDRDAGGPPVRADLEGHAARAVGVLAPGLIEERVAVPVPQRERPLVHPR